MCEILKLICLLVPLLVCCLLDFCGFFSKISSSLDLQSDPCTGRCLLCIYKHHIQTSWGTGIACWSERRTRDRMFASSNPGRSGWRIFFSRVNFVCWLLLGVLSTPVLSQWHVKDPGHSAKSAVGGLHLNTHAPLTHRSRSGLTMPLSGQSVGTYQETSSHATRQRTLGYSRLSSLSHCGLILA